MHYTVLHIVACRCCWFRLSSAINCGFSFSSSVSVLLLFIEATTSFLRYHQLPCFHQLPWWWISGFKQEELCVAKRAHSYLVLSSLINIIEYCTVSIPQHERPLNNNLMSLNPAWTKRQYQTSSNLSEVKRERRQHTGSIACPRHKFHLSKFASTVFTTRTLKGITVEVLRTYETFPRRPTYHHVTHDGAVD
jgi:hypothetical protein